jgi:tetratricopeptide (TPR) repeat protein
MIDHFEALGWLNIIDGVSRLTDREKRLSRAARVAGRSDESLRRILRNLRAASQASRNPQERAEAALHLAAVAYWKGWYSPAARDAKAAANGYQNDPHRQAISRWILGMAQWKTSRNDSAYRNWARARTIFRQQQNLLRGSSNQRDWYRDAVCRMEIELVSRPEEILTWLNRFEASSLTESSRQLVEVIEERIRQRSYPEANVLLRDLREINKWSSASYERAEVFLECGFAAYRMGNSALAIGILREAVVEFAPGIGNNHKQVIARCMLGALERSEPTQRNQGVIDWRRCIEELEVLRLQADRDNDQDRKRWYADHRAILEAALSDPLPRTRPPTGKRKRPRSNPPAPPPSGPNPSAPTPGTREKAPGKATNYEYLVVLVHGDIEQANRLIEFERRQFPDENLDQLIQRAIERLLKDRR